MGNFLKNKTKQKQNTKKPKQNKKLNNNNKKNLGSYGDL